MAPISPGSHIGPRKAKKPTATTKTHRFESFSRRIAKLKIDPIHRVERIQEVDEDPGLSQSHFRISLDYWLELNLSRVFTDFAAKASPLSESLPQLLHHADTILEFLVLAIGQNDALALEPLLSLLSHFAHDLGQEFETYFPRTVTLVAQVAASHDAPEVIEWCFTCLAWKFKFLSRLLVPDLRPLLEIMLPYLGSRKTYVTRFTAEALAFLLRKAATLYPRNKEPLKNAICYLMKTLQRTEETLGHGSSKLGLMTLFSEAAVGAESTLHAGGAHIVTCLLEEILATCPISNHHMDVLEGVVVGLIHQTNKQGLAPLIEVIHENCSSLNSGSPVDHISLGQSLLYLAVTTRKASRIREWNVVCRDILHLSCIETKSSELLVQKNLEIIAIVMQYAPIDELLPFANKMIEVASSSSTSTQFYRFCDFFATLGPDRFQTLLLSSLQHYIVQHWRHTEIALCQLLLRLQNDERAVAFAGQRGHFHFSPQMEEFLVDKILESLNTETGSIDCLSQGYLKLVDTLDIPKSAAARTHLQSSLKDILTTELQKKQNTIPSARTRAVLGRGFLAYLRLTADSRSISLDFWPLVSTLSVVHFRLIPFLTSLSGYADTVRPSGYLTGDDARRIRNNLLENLLSDSSTLKTTSLGLLKSLMTNINQDDNEVMDLAVSIISTTYTPSNARQIAMLLRRLPMLQKKVSDDYRPVVPFLCMGLLSSYHDETRRILCSIIGQLAAEPKEEVSIVRIALNWLQELGKQSRDRGGDHEDESGPMSSDFECSNVAAIRRISRKIAWAYEEPDRRLSQSLENEDELISDEPPSQGRTIALQLLQEIPEIAEKRSRLIVPSFLSSLPSYRFETITTDSNESISSRTLSPGIHEADWTLQDRREFLILFAKFSNPRVLYRSEDVYAGLLELLKNGNMDTRRLALKAVFTWRSPGLQGHQEKLMRLLDEKVFSSVAAQMLRPEEVPRDITRRTQLLDVLLRLLYGQMVGRSSGHGSQEAKRKSILRTILSLPSNEVAHFIRITLGHLVDVQIVQAGTIQSHLLETDAVPADQQYGLLRLVHSMLEVLQTQAAPVGKLIVQPVLYCTLRASHKLNLHSSSRNADEKLPANTMDSNIRKVGLQCLDTMFQLCDDIDWTHYLSLMFSELITPRLQNFANETAQGISWLLRLFSTWAKSPRTIECLYKYEECLLSSVWDCLNAEKVKDEVKIFLFDEMILPLATLAGGEFEYSALAVKALEHHLHKLLLNIAYILRNRPSKEVLQSALTALSAIAPLARSTTATRTVLEVLTDTLRDSNLHISPKVRGNLLKAVESLLAVNASELDAEIIVLVWKHASLLFNYFKDLPNRTILCNVLDIISLQQEDLAEAARLCRELNSGSSAGLADVDFDRQISALERMNGIKIGSSNEVQWLPLLNNLLFFMRKSEDLAVRSNVVTCLRRFIIETCKNDNPGPKEMICSILLPAFTKGVSEDSEPVRADSVFLFGLLVQHLGDSDLEDLKVLLVQNDDEASFFTNILHIQHHRRQRALRRLVEAGQRGIIKASNVSGFFMPLLERFATEVSEDSNAQSLKGQSIIAIGSLMQWIEWRTFKNTLRRYRKGIDSELRSGRDMLKLLGVAADALDRATNESMATSTNTNKSHLTLSLPTEAVIANELRMHIIPKLTDFIHMKDESQISSRLPAAITAVKLLKLLPEQESTHSLSPLLLDISQILRSRAQESRDAARATLSQIVMLVGPSSMQFVLKELRASLSRGYQLHVLSYTTHSILVATADYLKPGDLDYCLHDLVAVVMDDIFGVTGQEKDSEGYISSMKEVKSSKSYDSMELLAKSTGVRSLSKLLLPLQTLLEGTVSTKQSRQIDELLRRVGMGLSRNKAASSRDLLTFAYELIQEVYRQKAGRIERKLTNDEINRQRYMIQLSRAYKITSGTTSPLLYKVARFALNLVRSIFQKHDSLLTVQNVHGFLPVIGDSLIEAEDDVKVSALRLLSTVMKVPMPELDENAPLYVLEAVKIVKSAISTNEEASQAALKLVAAVLRERKTVHIRDSDLAYLLHRLSPDLEEPDRQGVTFNFIKAVMARKFVLPEVYEVVDKIGIMMVANHARGARDIARGVYVHFLLDYPQSRSRWTKQLKFLLKNLEYKHPEGRQSIMEAVNLLLAKTDSETSEEIVGSFFVPVVLRMSNDEQKDCRELAAALLGHCFRKADSSHLRTLLGTLRSWVEQTENSDLVGVGMQAYGVFFSIFRDDVEKEVPQLRACIEKVLQMYSHTDAQADWEMVFHALQLFSKIVVASPAQVMSRKQGSLWKSVCSLLLDQHPWIRSSIVSLLSLWFHDLAEANADDGFSKVPLVGKQGLQMDRELMLGILRMSLRSLKNNEGDEELNDQIVPIIMFIGRCICVNFLTVDVRNKVEDNQDGKKSNKQDGELSADSESNDENTPPMKEIPAIQYLLHQVSTILRFEPMRYTRASLLPKKSALQLLSGLIPHVASNDLQHDLIPILLPLHHLTDPNITAPKSSDPTFAIAYRLLVESAHEVITALQRRIGSELYVKAVTDVSRRIRQRREERRTKRRIERVSEPERAALKRSKKTDRGKERKKELSTAHMRRRSGL